MKNTPPQEFMFKITRNVLEISKEPKNSHISIHVNNYIK